MSRPPAAVVPAGLRRGDAVGVVAPAFPPRTARSLKAGLRALERWGLVPKPGAAIGRRHGYFAGTDEQRAADLQAALEDPDTRAVLFARGGWGTSRLLDSLDLSPLRRRPKILLGYSDLTVLFSEVWKRTRLVCAYGPVVAELGVPRAFHRPSLHRALFRPGEPLALRVGARSVLARGRARGPLLGGCLTLLAHLCGTKRTPDFSGAVVFIEEIGEEPYRLDRMLWQMRAAGLFDGARAVLAGRMTACEPRAGMRSFSAREVLADHLGALGVPVLLDLPAGHGAGKRTLPLGFVASVDAAAGSVTLRPGRA